MGTAAKLVVPTESQPPLVARQDGSTTWWCYTGAGEDGLVREALAAFAGTRSAIDAVSENWPERLGEALPEVRLGTGSVRVDWGREEWSGGCYSALSVPVMKHSSMSSKKKEVSCLQGSTRLEPARSTVLSRVGRLQRFDSGST